MHIVHVVTRLLRAGSEENTVETCRWQAAAGHRVTLVHGVAHDPYWEGHLPPGVTRIAVPDMVHPVHPVQDRRAVTALRRLYRDLAPDVIHTHQSKAGILGRMAARAVPGALVVHGVHIVPFEGVTAARRALYIAAERMVARHTDLFIGVTRAVGRAYVEAGIARPAQVCCVRSGMDLDRFRAPAPPADWRGLLGLAQGAAKPRVVLMMAAFEPRKRHLDFLQSFAKVVQRVPDAVLLLAGAGPEEGRVRSAVTGLGLQHRVVFCGHRPDPEALFALADLSVLTSEREGLPRVVVQSLAAGCPALVQHLPGLEELVHHGDNGWIAAPDDMDGTARQVCALIAQPEALAHLRQGALETDLSAWALDALGAQTTALYEMYRAGDSLRRVPA
ncbi:MAG: glycosyltransferase [Pseudomonadota bacterium]